MTATRVKVMAKRGRPKSTGDSGTIRVPKDIYLMVHWVADALRVTSTRVADKYLRQSATDMFLELYDRIKERRKDEEEAAKLDGRAPTPLPRILLRLPSSVYDWTKGSEGGWIELDPKEFNPKGRRVFYMDELSDGAFRKLMDLRAICPFYMDYFNLPPSKRPGDEQWDASQAIPRGLPVPRTSEQSAAFLCQFTHPDNQGTTPPPDVLAESDTI